MITKNQSKLSASKQCSFSSNFIKSTLRAKYFDETDYHITALGVDFVKFKENDKCFDADLRKQAENNFKINISPQLFENNKYYLLK